jgi:hypothetical protein
MDRLKPVPILTLILILAAFQGCSGSAGCYAVRDRAQNRELSRLFSALEKEEDSSESRFIIIQQIVKVLRSTGEQAKVNLFLTSYVQKNPADAFNANYLLTVALNYNEKGDYPFAVHYFERILRNYQDLLVRGVSVHYTCLTNLITMTQNPEVRVDYYRELIGRFGDIIERGPTFYYMGKTYEELGEWDLAIQAYKSFLASPDPSIPGKPDAEQEIREMIQFYDRRDKNWTMESLDQLVNVIKEALWAGTRGNSHGTGQRSTSSPYPGKRNRPRRISSLSRTSVRSCGTKSTMRTRSTLIRTTGRRICGPGDGPTGSRPGTSTSGRSTSRLTRRSTASGNGPASISGTNHSPDRYPPLHGTDPRDCPGSFSSGVRPPLPPDRRDGLSRA